jgi:hypothetical protein
VIFDEEDDPITWADDWEMVNYVDEAYGCISPPLDPFIIRQDELHLQMVELFNPFGYIPLPC